MHGFQPQTLNVVVIQCIPLVKLVELWHLLNPRSPTGHTGCLKLFSNVKVPMDLYPALPDFKLQFGQSCSLPRVKPSKYGLLGLEEMDIIFIDSDHGGKVIHKAVMIGLKDYILCDHFSRDITGLSFVTHFDASRSLLLCPGHLEQLAIACPNLEHLNLLGNDACLDRLQVLYAISTHCKNLQGLNLLTLPVDDATQALQLWEILVDMRLTYLAIEHYMITNIRWVEDKQAKEKMIHLFQECINLKALEIHFDGRVKKRELSVFSNFPSLVHCIVGNMSNNVEVMINSCSKLKYFVHAGWNSKFSHKLSTKNNNLEELCIKSFHLDTLSIPDIFMQSVSTHGGLVHVVLCAGTFSSGGIITLIGNSPKLLTFHIYAIRIKSPNKDIILKDMEMILKKKFANRNLFTCGSFMLSKSTDGISFKIDNFFIERRTNIFSLWSAESSYSNCIVNYE